MPGELAADAVSGLARAAGQARQDLARARDLLGPETPAATWREQLARLNSAGFSAAELTELFGGSRDTIRHDLAVIGTPAGLPDAATLVREVVEHGPSVLDGYAPAIDQPADRDAAAFWLVISPVTIAVNASRRRADGSRAWPLPDAGDRWTYRALVCHRAFSPGPGKMSPQGAARAGRIVAILAAAEGPLSTAEIRNALGLSAARNQPVLESLDRLARRGQVEKTSPGGGPRRVFWRLLSAADPRAAGQAWITWPGPEALDAAMRQWLDSHDSVPAKRAYGRVIREWLRWCGERLIPPEAAQPADVDAWRDSLAALGQTESTISRKLRILSGSYKHWQQRAVISASPAAGPETAMARTEVRRGPVSESRISRILNALADAPDGLTPAELIETLAETSRLPGGRGTCTVPPWPTTRPRAG